MKCPNCGYYNADGTQFCGSCGTKLQQAVQQPMQYQQPVQNFQQQNVSNPTATKTLILGIVAACLCWFPIASIILGIFAIKSSSSTLAYANQGYGKKAMGIVGKVLGIVSIVLCGIFTIEWIVLIIAACTAVSNINSTDYIYSSGLNYYYY